MEGDILEGTNQPGEPRLARRGDRGHEIMAENPLGNRTYGRVEELRDVTQICLWPKENKSIQTIWSDVQQTLTADEVLHVRKILRVRQNNNLMRYDLFVDNGNAANVLTKLSQVRGQMKWWARLHINYWDRKRRQPRERIQGQDQGNAHIQDEVIRGIPYSLLEH